MAQERVVENRPYTDLRPIHFGILVGTHFQDLELANVGPQTLNLGNGSARNYDISADQDSYDNGFHVGVLSEFRLNRSFQFRVAPTLYFGARHINFKNRTEETSDTLLRHSQNLKTVYIGCSFDMIYGAQRFNNHRPYVMLGLSPMINLSGKKDDFVQLKPYDLCLEAGIGCDFYLPYFKLRPELKFMFGLTNSLDTDHALRLRDESMQPYALSVNKGRTKMIALTFYFE